MLAILVGLVLARSGQPGLTTAVRDVCLLFAAPAIASVLGLVGLGILARARHRT